MFEAVNNFLQHVDDLVWGRFCEGVLAAANK